MVTIRDLDTGAPRPPGSWCPGCGNYGIIQTVKKSLIEHGLDPWDVVILSGIGCHGKLPHWVKTYGLHAIHGRTLPAAQAIKLANHELTVIAHAGDGDALNEGGNHFIHACRRNIDITFVIHNNEIYGLTTGQASPTSEQGLKTKTTPTGVLEIRANPVALAITAGATWVARGFAGDVSHLTTLYKEAIIHKGFAVLDVIQPCVTFGPHRREPGRGFDWYRERIYQLEDMNHDLTDKWAALQRADEWGEKIPIGVFYKEIRPTYRDGIPNIATIPLVKHDIHDVDISEALKELI
ncbi:MAG: thiamine pyrophosphate-dependent enzyme [Candidatus Heimdallarchaeota archaeon]